MLDHSIAAKLHPSNMSIRRKWVSDTNLSKLLHETIEKKEANKQSKLPDFCKDAILSATIKKISSALLTNQNPSCPETVELESLEDQNQQQISVDPHSCNDISDEQWEDYSDIAMSLDNVDLEDIDSNSMQKPDDKSSSRWNTAHPPVEKQPVCHSPKRKRQPSHEGAEDNSNFTNLETVASPCKKRRADFLKCKSGQNQSNFIVGGDDESWSEDESESESSDSRHNSHRCGIHAQRSQSLPHLTFFSKEDLISPSKNSSGSVVNSISELSINDCLGTSVPNSWCFSNDEPADADPLELNGFFQELSTVSANSNS